MYLKSNRALQLLALVGALASCSSGDSGTGVIEQRLMKQLEAIRVVDCHEHIRPLQELEGATSNFFTILARSYLRADLVSAGAPNLTPELARSEEPEDLWDTFGPFLALTRQTTYYQHLMYGFRQLHQFPDREFTRSGVAGLSDRIARRYAEAEQWFDEAFRQSGFEVMLLDKHWDPWNPEMDRRYFRPVFNITALVNSVSRRSRMVGSTGKNPWTMASRRGDDLQDLDSYLRSAEVLFQEFEAAGAAAVKNTLAYSRSLRFEDVTRERAKELFAKDQLNAAEVRELEDYLVHWVIRRSIAAGLPMQIHTGYLASNSSRLDQTDPILLNNLFIQYPEARFVLFHGGYPWTSEVAALAKMFPNVSLDLVWLPQISRVKAIAALDEILDGVPYNKLFWGGDCHFIEEAAGSLAVGREVVVRVLARRIASGEMSEGQAHAIGAAIFRENGLRFFRLGDGQAVDGR